MLAQLTDQEGYDLIIVGPEEPLDHTDVVQIRSLRQHPRVTVVGPVENVDPFYAEADILILPTRREGLPTVVLEAGSFSVPTVAFNVTGTRDCIIDQVTGILVDANDSEAFRRAVLDLLDDPERRRRMGQEARRHIEERYDRTTVHSQWIDFLTTVTT